MTGIDGNLMQIPVMVAGLREIQELHKPMTTMVISADCAFGECEHEDEECPEFEFTYCAACNEIAEWVNPDYAEDPGMNKHVEHPCATRQLADKALEGVA